MKQLNLRETTGLRRAVRPVAGLALSALLAAFGCSTTDTSDQPRSLLPNAHLRSTERLRTSETVAPLRSLDPLGAAVATSGDSLPARSFNINQPLPPGGVATLGPSNPGPGPAGGTQVATGTSPLFGVREITINPSIANPYGAVGVVNGDTGGVIIGSGLTAGATVGAVSGVSSGVAGVGTTGATGVAGAAMGIGVATTPNNAATTTGIGTATVPTGVTGVGTLGVNGVAGPGSSSGTSTVGIGVAGPIAPGATGSLTTGGLTTGTTTASGTTTGTTTTASGTAPLTTGTATGRLVTGFTSTGTTSSTSATQAQTAGRSRFRIVNMFRRGTVTVQPTH